MDQLRIFSQGKVRNITEHACKLVCSKGMSVSGDKVLIERFYTHAYNEGQASLDLLPLRYAVILKERAMPL